MKNKNFIYMIIFAAMVITIAELIGIKAVQIGKVRIALLPLAFALAIGMVAGLAAFRKGIMKKVYSKENVEFAGKYLIIIMPKLKTNQ